MLLYKVGKIISIKEKYVILETNYNGEIIYTPNPNNFEIGKIQKVFVYEYKTERVYDLYGFLNLKERYLFRDLISISGIGPKTSAHILSYGLENIINMIACGDIEAISQIPNLGLRIAKQIVFELQEKYKQFTNSNKIPEISNNSLSLKSALKTLGFQKQQINNALSNIQDFSKPLEQLVEQSINMISNAK